MSPSRKEDTTNQTSTNTTKLTNLDDNPPPLISPENIDECKKKFKDALGMVNSVFDGKNMFDEDNEFTFNTTARINKKSMGKINENKNQRNLNQFVTCDGIVFVSLKHPKMATNLLWPGRISSVSESDHWRATFKSDNIPNWKLCVIIYFPFEYPKQWWHAHFVSKNDIFPFVEKEDERLEGLCIDTYRKYRRGMSIAAGLKKWALKSGLTKPKTKIGSKISGTNSFHSKMADLGKIYDIQCDQWMSISKETNYEQVVKMIEVELEKLPERTGKQKSKNKGTSCIMNNEKIVPISEENTEKSHGKDSSGNLVLGTTISVKDSRKPVTNDQRNSITEQLSSKKTRKLSILGNSKNHILDNNIYSNQQGSSNGRIIAGEEADDKTLQKIQDITTIDSTSHHGWLKQICHKMESQRLSEETKDIYQDLESIPKTNGEWTDVDVRALLRSMTKMVERIHRLENKK